MTRVFISYSHDSDAHREFVRGISDRLRKEGLDCLIDLYVNGFPPEGWQRWMENQIESADFVLLVCTETYLRRYRGQETEGGRGVTFEGVVISQTLYDHYYRNTKFIPMIPTHGSLDHVPLTLKPYSTYCLPSDYDKLYRVLTGQAEYIAPPLGEIRSMPAANGHTPPSIHSDRLPTVKGGFFGRTAELQLLNTAWANTTTRIIQFIAPGGTGKTKLLRHWLDHTTDIPVLIAWSFYSQGASEDKQTSATPFFSHAFAKLGSTRERFASEEDKGDHLAELLHGKRYVLVLDGLEPLQHGGAAMRGELKDKAIRQLLRQLARHPCGLCIITTRIALHELSDRDAPTVIRHDLQNLTGADGIQLLQSLGVTGSAAELGKAVGEYGGHALALSLLGNVLRLRHQGDVRKRDTLKALVKAKGNQDSRHAFKVMQAYAEWFAGEPELALLHLLGLFDHPIGQDVLQMLWDAQIPHLTADIDEDEWLEAIASLREEHHLLSQHDSGGDLDCHPLIREYFGGQLQTQQPQAWQQAHERLYEYYKALPKNPLPDTLEEMQPLFSAVAHGCAAGLHTKSWEEVYWARIKRGNEHYIEKKLGAFSDNLATISHFFSKPWRVPASDLNNHRQALILNLAGFGLRALGRLRELEPMQANSDYDVKHERWLQAAQATNNLSELQLTLGDVAQAVESSGARSSRYADQSGDWQSRMMFRTTHADALHQAGDTAAALALFREAEQLQQENQPSYPRLYSLGGFRYCDLLLAQGSTEEVLERYEQWVEWRQDGDPLLDRSLEYLTLGRAHLQQLLLPSTSGRGAGGEGLHWLEQAVAGLRAAGTLHNLPWGLLARAALHRHTRDFARARQDLQEVFDIADGSGMRLHLTDYHLEMARLLVAEEKEGVCNTPLQGTADVGAYCIRPLQYHIAEAERLIAATGYHRRDKELMELQAALT
ncbi:toll/interleukin-1 receptor domain-containing protein [Thiothrix winogradskyi]|uniref:Toll/interleukin-1 receptor domain-containing protein n=1 Tax=Thiothrix winogradskyi TaxID=96472 RepID=A0ABY3T232_9GAMM|nr:toll/interleukin-1 receptor domain-containing protein [Thiothrix winogradskyi]UJS25458.1 toll/interleukin-1 receptor domain-containing protein [Thiothrix winogradskyi]